ncbi:TRAP transporter substrate-binding protein DctP [Pararhodobacter marinus]|uniref:ABC transporter substrate-binding protein n=1 Tax=Pararhodobacter marinus TaxID=2184063 RepID=A0A2U2CAN3_9RHOB|nr:TRAP transporter substrate-binding protein DctP [Pararhodobacter marinus]PWE28913.1 ABC transporter substrate-binding protein [Pararhodobacter marinus]
MNKTIALAMASCLIGAPALAQTTLRVVTAFPQGTMQNIPLTAFVEHVNETCTDSVTLNFVGGPEAIPTFELGEAVRRGVVDVGFSSQSFYTSIVPDASAIRLSTNSAAEQRENGGWELLNRIHNERMNAYYLARTSDGIPFHLYLTEEADPLDLSGVSLRIAPVYRAFFEDLGATVVQIPPAEVYPALERGVVQGVGWTSLGLFDQGWDQHIRYRVDPGFYVSDSNILVNLDRWNGLDAAAQDCLSEAALWVEGQDHVLLDLQAEELQRQADAGVQVIALDGERRDEFLRRASDAGWAELERLQPEYVTELRELLAPESAE